MTETTCTWAEDIDAIWNTDCGQSFVFEEDTPTGNRMNYCCYCGKRLEVVPHPAPPCLDEDEE